MKQPISQEAWDWAAVAVEEMEAYKLANPHWENHFKTYEEFRKSLPAPSSKKEGKG